MIRELIAVHLIKQKVLRDGVRKQSYQIATNSEATEIAHTPQLLGIKENNSIKQTTRRFFIKKGPNKQIKPQTGKLK